MVGIVESIGEAVKTVKPGDRVAVNVETFCGECFFCRHGWVNNCIDSNGGWALGCRIDGGQTEFVRVPFADNGLTRIPDNVSDKQALFVGDILATGYWAAKISEIGQEDTVLIIGAGPTGLCTLQCVSFTVLTASPIDSTIPTISCPTVIPGTALGTLPCLICKSLVQILLRVTLTTASVGSEITGFVFSVTSNRPLPIYVNAFIVFLKFH